MDKYSTEKSRALFEKAQSSIIGGVASSIHKYAWQDYPIYMERGKGAKLYDADGNEYIDYLLGFGPEILGYVDESFTKAIIDQLQLGTQVAAPTESLIELADKLIEVIPCAEKVSTFYNSGTEANLHAIRLARAYTGKMKFVKFEGQYHGWADELKVSAEAPSVAAMGPRNRPWKLKSYPGQREPEDVIVLPYNDLQLVEETFKRQGNEIAAVICEQIMFNAHPVFPMKGFLEGLRELTAKYGVVLIFDEVITGFRCSLGGAQGYFGVTPDVATFAKAMGGGVPVSVVVGKEEVVSALSATAGTFNGNPLSVAASLATIKELEKPGVYEALQKKSERIVDETIALGRKYGIPMYGRAVGATWALLMGTDGPLTDYRDGFSKINVPLYEKFVAGCLDRGVRLNPWRGRMYMSTAHTDAEITRTVEIFDDVLSELRG